MERLLLSAADLFHVVHAVLEEGGEIVREFL